MAQEASKLRARWQKEGLWKRFFNEDSVVLDIGCGDDKIVPSARGYDREDGDAQYLNDIPDDSFNVVFSAHCLEHMRNPSEALRNWWRVLRPGGFLIVEVPDEDLYEQGVFPSAFNGDHKFTYTISKEESWSPTTMNLASLLAALPKRKVYSIRTVDEGYDYSTTELRDQTYANNADAAIEAIVQKAPVQRQLVTVLKKLVLCPTCSRGELVIRGITKENKYAFQCYACGLIGEFEISLGDEPVEEHAA